MGGKGGSSRCKQARNDSFPEKMSLEFAHRRPRHQSGFNKILKAEHRVWQFKKRMNGEEIQVGILVLSRDLKARIVITGMKLQKVLSKNGSNV